MVNITRFIYILHTSI